LEGEVTMSPKDKEYSAELVDEFLRYLRGRGPRPQLEKLPRDERAEFEDLFHLLEVIVDTDEVEVPPIEEDPVAVRLGLLAGGDQSNSDAAGGRHSGEFQDDSDPIAISLEEVAHRLSGEVELVPDRERTVPGHDANGLLPAQAVCRTLGEVVLVCVTDGDEFSELPRKVALVFGERPTTTAVAVVSTASYHAVVLTEADCIRAIDPIVGWVDPGLPRPPEPLGLALGRYLQGSLPRWDEIARLDDMLVSTHTDEDVTAAVWESLNDHLNRSVRIPAKRTALEHLRNLPSGSLESAVNDVRAGRLAGDGLLQRLHEVSKAGAP